MGPKVVIHHLHGTEFVPKMIEGLCRLAHPVNLSLAINAYLAQMHIRAHNTNSVVDSRDHVFHWSPSLTLVCYGRSLRPSPPKSISPRTNV